MENKIILIEDDEEIRSMVKDYLSGEFQVLPFSEGKTAIHTVKNYDEYSLGTHRPHAAGYEWYGDY